MINAQFSAKTKFLFKPCRYKVLYGGRGSGKSWAMARALLLLATQKTLRVLCVLELKKEITDANTPVKKVTSSVKQLLS